MILQALARYYDVLAEKGELDRAGWLPGKMSWALDLDEDGQLLRVAPLEEEAAKGKKTVFVPRQAVLPAPVKRTVGVSANFLCDNSSYMLGIGEKGKPERSRQCFEACRELHLRLLGESDEPAARAVCAFFRNWQPELAAEHPALEACLKEVIKGGNLVFLFQSRFVHEIPSVKACWDRCYQTDDDLPVRQCLVTGEYGPVAVLHPAIKGIVGAQSSGASLVSFNAPSFESYGLEGGQGLNAPVGKQAAFAYGAALNHLIAKQRAGKKTNLIRLSDMSIVFWAENGQQGPVDLFNFALQGSEDVSDEDLRVTLSKLANGQTVEWHDETLNPDNPFYVLGISPNAARLSVRFFMRDSFGKLMSHVAAHQERLRMVKPAFKKFDTIPMWALLRETANQKSKDKQPSPQLSGEMMRAVLNDSLYPAALYEQIQMRIRAEKDVPWEKASMIKAYLTKNMPDKVPEEVRDMVLNEETTYAPYVLGRLFAVLEGLQEAANGDTNTTIRDRYFNSACATPGMVFPTLIRLAQAHLKKVSAGSEVYYSKQITDLLGRLDQDFPKRLNLTDQGVFQIGYYHQTQKRYAKGDKDNG